MGDIIGSVISILTDNPIFALALIFIVLSNLLKSGKSSNDTSYDEQYNDPYDTGHTYENNPYEENPAEGHHSRSTSSMTWEDMERAYGIKIARKDEPVPVEEEVITPVEETFNTTVEDVQPASVESAPPIVVATKTETTEYVEPVKKNKKRALSLEERLAQYNAERTATLQELEMQEERPVLDYSTEKLDGVEPSEKRNRAKLTLSAKEGMKWAIILDKPKALRPKYR